MAAANVAFLPLSSLCMHAMTSARLPSCSKKITFTSRTANRLMFRFHRWLSRDEIFETKSHVDIF